MDRIERLVIYLREHRQFMISELAAERILAEPQPVVVEVKGRDCVTGLPSTLKVTGEEIYRATKAPG